MKRVMFFLTLMFFAGSVFAYPMNPSEAGIVNALDYLKAQQDSDGCIGGFATSAWVISAVVVAGQNPASVEWSNGGNSLVDCIKADSPWFNDPSRSATDFERQIIAIVAAGEDPANFNSLDYVAKLKSMYDGTQMAEPDLLNDDMWGIIALIAAGESPASTEIQGMLSFIESNQGVDNGWSWGVGQASDADMTATAVMALIAAGREVASTNIQNAMAYLKTQQDTTNAGLMSWGAANPDSTSYGIDGIVSVGQDPTDVVWQESGTNPVEYLLTWQQLDGGFSNPYSGGVSSEWTTANAINALLAKPYPVEIIQTLTMPIRIESPDQTILDAEIELPDSIQFTANSGTPYTLTDTSLLMGLLQASEDNSFAVVVSDEYYPAMGFYVSSIAGYDAAGMEGWSFRVDNHSTGFHSADSFIWQVSDPPDPPHSGLVWYYGEWDEKPLRVTTSGPTDINAGDTAEVLVEYYEEYDAWYVLEGATVKGADNEQTTNGQGIATITFSFGGTKQVYAEADGYFRSDKLEFNVSGGQQTNSSVEVTGEIIPSVSFSVTPTSISLGQFGPGYTVAGPNLNLDNTGSWNLEVEAEVTDEEGTLYSESLLLNGEIWSSFLLEIPADAGDFFNREIVSAGLSVPSSYSGIGAETGTITFWATAIGIPE